MSTPAKVISIHSSAQRPLDERSADEQMLLAAAGRRDAFEALVRRYLPRVSRFCAKYAGSVAAGDDLAQDVFVKLWSARDRYRPSGKFEVFLFTLARNACRNHVRFAFLRRSDADSADDGALETTCALDEVLARESERRVRVELSRLPPRLREAVLLRFDQDLGYRDVAVVLGIPEATARTRVFNGLRRLRERLDGEQR